MAFKMKGPSIHKGSARHKSLIKAHQKQLRLNRSMDSTNLPDGRSKSSMFQMKSSAVPYTKRSTLRNEEEWKEGKKRVEWGEEELVSEKKYEEEGGVTGTEQVFTTQGVEITPATREVEEIDPNFGKPGSDICKEAAAAGIDCDEYIIEKERELGYKQNVENLEKKRVKRTTDVPDPDPDPDPVPDPDPDPPKKMCHCKTYAQRQAWQGASTQRKAWAKYECGTDLPPECIKPKREGDTRTGFIETSKEEKQKQTTFEGRIPG